MPVTRTYICDFQGCASSRTYSSSDSREFSADADGVFPYGWVRVADRLYCDLHEVVIRKRGVSKGAFVLWREEY